MQKRHGNIKEIYLYYMFILDYMIIYLFHINVLSMNVKSVIQ